MACYYVRKNFKSYLPVLAGGGFSAFLVTLLPVLSEPRAAGSAFMGSTPPLYSFLLLLPLLRLLLLPPFPLVEVEVELACAFPSLAMCFALAVVRDMPDTGVSTGDAKAVFIVSVAVTGAATVVVVLVFVIVESAQDVDELPLPHDPAKIPVIIANALNLIVFIVCVFSLLILNRRYLPGATH